VKQDFRRYLFLDYDKGNLGLFELMDAKEYAAGIFGRNRHHDA
jgi:hypothetical protein